MRPLVVTSAALAIALAGGPMAAASPWDDAQRVPRAQIVAALRHEQAQGYRIEAIANSVRLQCNVLLALTDQARAADPLQRPLRIDHRDYFSAFLEVTGLAPMDAPSFAQAPHRAKEDYLVDYRLDQVLDPAQSPDLPRRALNVKAGWPAAADAPESYSYEDRSTDPAIETRRQQVTSWRILDYGEAIVYDDLRGVTGRATSGLLGAIFSVIGHAQARQTRFAIAPDGLQVSRTTARKGLTLTQTITIRPDGSVLTGLPAERPDLVAIDRRLAGLPLRVAYRPMERSPLPPSVP